MFRVLRRARASHWYMAAHGIASVAGVLLIRYGGRAQAVPCTTWAVWLTALFRAMASLWSAYWWCGRCAVEGGGCDPLAWQSAEVCVVRGERPGGSTAPAGLLRLLAVLVDAAMWGLTEGLSVTSLIYNSVAVHLMVLLLLVGLSTLTNAVLHGPLCSASGLWDAGSVVVLGEALVLSLFTLVAIGHDDQHARGSVALFAYALLSFYRRWCVDALQRARPPVPACSPRRQPRPLEGLNRRRATLLGEGPTTLAAARCVLAFGVLSVYAVCVPGCVWVWPQGAGCAWWLLTAGCACRATAQCCLDASRATAPCREGHIVSVWLLTAESVACLLIGYYFLCEVMHPWSVVSSLASVGLLAAFSLTLTVLSGVGYELDAAAHGMERDGAGETAASVSEDYAADAEEGPLMLLAALVTLHNGFGDGPNFFE